MAATQQSYVIFVALDMQKLALLQSAKVTCNKCSTDRAIARSINRVKHLENLLVQSRKYIRWVAHNHKDNHVAKNALSLVHQVENSLAEDW